MKNSNDKKTFAIDRFLFLLADRYLFRISIALLLLGSVLLRYKLAPEIRISADYDMYIAGWPAMYREMGFVEGMSHTVGDYYVPFNIMYAIIGLSPWEPWVLASVFSCTCDYIGAFFIYKIAGILLTEKNASHADIKAAFIGTLSLYLPFVFINSALWKQCDSIYICFALASLYLLLKDKYAASFVFLGISFAFKLQAIFFIPFYLTFYMIRRRFSVLQFLWLPFVYLLAGLPAVWCHRGIKATYLTYFMQTLEGTEGSEGYGLVAIYPNLYNLGLDDFLETFSLPAVIFTAMLLMLSMILAFRLKERFTFTNMVYLLVWQIWTFNMFLPSMHERYDYGAVLLISMLAFILPERSLLVAALLNVGSYITYLTACNLRSIPIPVLSLFYIAGYFYMSWELVLLYRGRPGVFTRTTAKS